MRAFVSILFTLCLVTSSYAAPQTKSKSVQLNEQGVAALQANDFAKAEKLLKQAIDVDSANVTAIYNLAGAYVANKKEKAAIELLEKVVKNHKSDAGLFVRLGDAYFSNQDIKGARKSYENAYQLDPKQPNLAIKLATIYSLTKNLPKAEEFFKAAIEQNPKDAQTLANYSSILLANNKPEEAIAAAKKSLQHEVSDQAYLTLGSAYEAMKNIDDALIAYEKAFALGNTDKDLKTKIEELKKHKS
ncbi:MAG: tetratricopeptide repeat protein [Deltaproteobacteria bacterium]|nr:tetratricopeptide repeat protein [Deltaproteobacteria bacterium]